MSRLALALLLLVLPVASLACDHASDWEDCFFTDDPAAAPGSRESKCMPSAFKAEDNRARESVGVVRRGDQPLEGAIVNVKPWPGLSAVSGGVQTTTTEADGSFHLRQASFRYDLTVKDDKDVLIYSGVGRRYLEPSIEAATQTFPRVWKAHVDVRLDAPVPDDHAIAFFVGGDRTIGTTGDLETGVDILSLDFVTRATLHAIEYVKGKALGTAVASGKIDLMARAGSPVKVAMHLDPVHDVLPQLITATGPSGFEASTADVRIGFSRSSGAVYTTIPLGVETEMPFVPAATFYTFRVTARRGDEISDSGEVFFDPHSGELTTDLPSPPTAMSPLEGATLGVGKPLVARGKGVFEHMLDPKDGGPSIRIVVSGEDVPLPDIRNVGAQAAGAYSWRVRSWPSFQFSEDLVGIDARRFRPFAVSAPRSIQLR